MNPLKKTLSIYRTIKNTVNQTGVTGAACFSVFWDIIFCRLKYKCTFNEYIFYQFYKYKNFYRKKYLLYSHIKFLKTVVPVKPHENSKYTNYLRYKTDSTREMIKISECSEEDFLKFITAHPKFIIKPESRSLGVGIKVFDSIDKVTALALFNSMKDDTICEEYVFQHPEIAKLNSESLNTLRVISTNTESGVEILFAAIRIGKDKDCVTDNMATGGMAAAIDLETGVVVSPAMDLKNNVYVYHPTTKCKIVGLEIPYWEQVKKTIIETHKTFSERPIMGCDIAIKADGVEIIEINVLPGPHLMQIDHMPRGDKIFAAVNSQKNKKV